MSSWRNSICLQPLTSNVVDADNAVAAIEGMTDLNAYLAVLGKYGVNTSQYTGTEQTSGMTLRNFLVVVNGNLQAWSNGTLARVPVGNRDMGRTMVR